MVYNLECANQDGSTPQVMNVGQLKKILNYLPEKMLVLAGGVDELGSQDSKDVYQTQCFMFLETFNPESGVEEHGLVLLGRKANVKSA